jgi:hypothetical protein
VHLLNLINSSVKIIYCSMMSNHDLIRLNEFVISPKGYVMDFAINPRLILLNSVHRFDVMSK